MKLMTAIAFFVLSIFGIRAEETKNELEVTVASAYRTPGSGEVLSNDLVYQAGITRNITNGFWVNLWFSRSPNGEIDYGDEIDYTVGWSGDAPRYLRQAIGLPELTLGLTVSYFDEPSIPTEQLGDELFIREENSFASYGYVDLSTKPEIGTFGKGDIWFFEGSLDTPITESTSAGFHARNYQPISGSGFDGGWLIGYHGGMTFFEDQNRRWFLSGEFNWSTGFELGDGFVVNPSTGFEVDTGKDATLRAGIIAYWQLSTEDERPDNDFLANWTWTYQF